MIATSRLALLPPAMLALAAALAVVSLASFGTPTANAELGDSLIPPWFASGGGLSHPLGTDAMGRDLQSTMFQAARLSLAVAGIAVGGALSIGVTVGLLAGRAAGWFDALAMRAADVQMTFPALLVALLADAVPRLGGRYPGRGTMTVVITLGCAIALGRWPPIARLVRGATRREWRRDYVTASLLAGTSRLRALLVHVGPNVIGSVLALAALDLGLAVMDEATLSYLGLGLPADEPSLGTMIHEGQSVLFSGAWWVVLLPGATLVLLVAWGTLSADLLRTQIARRM